MNAILISLNYLTDNIIMTAEEYDALPTSVKEIVDTFDPEDRGEHFEMTRIEQELYEMGWSCEFGFGNDIEIFKLSNGTR